MILGCDRERHNRGLLRNNTFIVLIPKKKNSTWMTNFRPISLCNVIYNLIAKMLVNCMKIVLEEIISFYQSAFVPSPVITNNIMVGYRMLNFIKKKRGGKGRIAANA